MFSKAKLKRFNEEVGCAPPPTAYNPKPLEKNVALSLDRSERWKENKENLPAPNAYISVDIPQIKTPGRSAHGSRSKPRHRSPTSTTSSSILNSSTLSNCSSNSDLSSSSKRSVFLSPITPRAPRSSCARSARDKSDGVKLQLATLQRERDELQRLVASLEQKLASLKSREADEKERPIKDNEGAIAEKTSSALLEVAQQQLGAAQCAVSALQDEKSGLLLQLQQLQITSPTRDAGAAIVGGISDTAELSQEDLMKEEVAHLTMLRDNLEASVVHKNALIADLELQCTRLQEACQEHKQQLEHCRDILSCYEFELRDGEDEEGVLASSSVSRCVETLSQRYKSLLASNGALTQDHKQQISALQTELSQLKDKICDYEAKVTQLRHDATEQESTITALKENVQALEVLVKEKELMEILLQEEIRQRNSEMNLLEESYTAIETKLAEALARDCELSSERAARENAEKSLKQVELELATSVENQKHLQQELRGKREEITASQKKIEELANELTTVRQESLDLKEEVEGQLNQVLALRASLAAKDYDIDEREETIATLKEEIVTKTDLVNNLQKQLDSHKTAEVELNAQLREKTEAFAAIEVKMSEAQNKQACLEEQLKQFRSESETALLCLKDMHAAELHDLKALKDEETSKVLSLRRECVANEEAISELNSKLAEKEKTIQNFEQNIIQLTSELEDAEEVHAKNIKEARAEMDELSIQYSNSLLELESTKGALALATQHSQRVLLELEASEADIKEMKEDADKCQREVLMHIAEKQTLEDNLRKLTAKYTAFEQAKVADEAQREDLIRRLQAELELSKLSFSQLQSETTALQSTNTGFINQIQQLRQDLKKKSAAIEESKECIEVLREERRCALECKEELQSKADDRQNQIRDLRLKLEDLKSRVKDHENTIMQSNENLAKHISSIAQERQKAAAEREADMKHFSEVEQMLSRDKQELEQRVGSLLEQMEAVVELKDSFAEKVSLLEQDVVQLKVANAAAEQAKIAAEATFLEFDSMKGELEKNRKEAEESLAIREKLESEVTSARERFDMLEKQLLNVTQAKAEVESELAGVRDRLLNLQTENEACRNELNLATEALNELRSHHTECEELQTLVSTLSDYLTKSDDQKREWQAKCAQLEKLVEPFRDQLENYEAELEILMRSKTAAQKEVEDLSQKYVSLLGHQNHKQKIQHVVKLKAENLKLLEEVTKLRVESEKQRKTIKRLEERLGDADKKPSTSSSGCPGRVAKSISNKENTKAVPRSPLRPSNQILK